MLAHFLAAKFKLSFLTDCDHAVRGDPRVRAGRHGGQLRRVGRGAHRGQHAPRRLQLLHQLRILLRRHRFVSLSINSELHNSLLNG